MLEINIQIQKSESGYSAYSPEISDRHIQGDSLDSVVNEIKEIIRVYLENDSQQIPKSTGESLLNLFDNITADMTPDEIDQLPKDGAEQHDHYIYGIPKRPV
jgi:predicted RNase H-like HicB family nuclease